MVVSSLCQTAAEVEDRLQEIVPSIAEASTLCAVLGTSPLKMKEIQLTRGYVAIVDDEDFERFGHYKWKADVRKSGIVYAKRFDEKCKKGVRTRKSFYLHREIMGANGRDNLVDHENGNGLDCQKVNLRQCTHAENLRNKFCRKSATGFKGVHPTPGGRFAARITCGKYIYIGTFDTAREAASQYDRKAKELHGEFANLNFKE